MYFSIIYVCIMYNVLCSISFFVLCDLSSQYAKCKFKYTSTELPYQICLQKISNCTLFNCKLNETFLNIQPIVTDKQFIY